ncbi:MAG: HD domain-containing protein [Bacilli bacterium]|nr:HD domain-containing protein [Bacilli bacterium]
MQKMISEFEEQDHIQGQFLVANVVKGANASGSPYLNMELRDSSGTINAKKWDVFTNDENIIQIGEVIFIDADVIKYKDALQLKVTAVSSVNPEDVDVAKFIKAPPVPKEELIKRFNAHVESIQNEDCRKILDYLIKRMSPKLFDYPAAVSVHHDYASGLLMHTVSMADHAVYFANYYPDVNKDILLTGTLLHDMGKCIEFEGPVIYKYSLEGKLLGHIAIMMAEIRRAAIGLQINSEVPILLEHMVLAHHGQREFGSPVLPLTKEALLLYLIDNIDSKMVILDKALSGVEPGDFTQKIFPLDGRMFYKPKE